MPPKNNPIITIADIHNFNESFESAGLIVKPTTDKNYSGFIPMFTKKADYGCFSQLTAGIESNVTLVCQLQDTYLQTTPGTMVVEGIEIESPERIVNEEFATMSVIDQQLLLAAIAPGNLANGAQIVKIGESLAKDRVSIGTALNEPCPRPGVGKSGEYVGAYVPNAANINPSLKDFKAKQLLNIFPEAEAKVFMLAIGRALYGINGDTHAHNGLAIESSWRTFPVITGAPGVGKSVLCNSVLRAMKALGYKFSEFTTIGKQFGLKAIIEADLAYVDDLTSKSMAAMISSATFKTIVTSGTLRTEDKNVAEQETRARALLLANVNNFDSSILHSIDAGACDRLAVLQCLSPYELNGSNVWLNIKQLKEKYACTEQELFNAFFRQCVDYYVDTIKNSNVKVEVEKLKTKFRFVLPTNVHSNFSQLLLIAHKLIIDKNANIGVQLSGQSFCDAIVATNFLVNSQEANCLRNALKADWDANSRPNNHPWLILKNIQQITLLEASGLAIGERASLIAPAKAIKTLLADVRLEDGFKVSSLIQEITNSWNSERLTLMQQYSSFINNALSLNISLPEKPVSYHHLFNAGYDRQVFAEKMNIC